MSSQRSHIIFEFEWWPENSESPPTEFWNAKEQNNFCIKSSIKKHLHARVKHQNWNNQKEIREGKIDYGEIMNS